MRIVGKKIFPESEYPGRILFCKRVSALEPSFRKLPFACDEIRYWRDLHFTAHEHNARSVGAHGDAPKPISCCLAKMNPFQADNVALNLAGLDEYGAFMAFSLRGGGVSPPPFDSLNFSAEEGDSIRNVERNFQSFGKTLGINPDRIVTCRQIHGDQIVVVESMPVGLPEADAVVTATPGFYPAVKTADCVPILLVDPVRRVAAAVHVGWRGLVKRIARKVTRLMSDRFMSNPPDLIASLGPSIGKCCYEVDDRVLKPFREEFPGAEQFIITNELPNRSGNRTFLDLTAASRFELISQGICEENIHTVDLCTSCRPDLFFSHRRDGAKTGRHVAVTGFNS